MNEHTLEIDRLRALAMEATPHWYSDKYGMLMVSENDPMYMRGATIACAGSRVAQAKKNTAFIAAANPKTILAIIARLADAEARIDDMQQDLKDAI